MKRYLTLRKRQSVKEQPRCQGSSSSTSKNLEKINKEMEKLSSWQNLK